MQDLQKNINDMNVDKTKQKGTAQMDVKGDTRANHHDSASDIVKSGWVTHLPTSIRPYAILARLDRPIGTWLLLLPGLWSLALASDLHPDWSHVSPYYIALFAIGAIVMRGAGCVWNDITDQDYDRQVARTATRPLASGELKTRQAILFLILLCLIGLGILLQFNVATWAIGASSLFLVMAYPFMKRVTYWPQAWLGLTFNWGALLAWAVIFETIDWPALALYVAGFFWTLGYDTIYAHQDKEDDALVGVKSTALRLGNATRKWVIGFYSLTHAIIGVTAYFLHLDIWFWPFFILAACQFAYQIWQLDINDPDRCLALFKSNKYYGLLLFIGFAVSGLNISI